MIRSRIPCTAILLVMLLPACAKGVAQAAETPAAPTSSLESEKPAPRISLPPPETEPASSPVATEAPAPVAPPAAEPGSRPTDVMVTGFETGGTSGLDGHVGDPKTSFAAKDTVYLAVLAEGALRSIKLEVNWLGPDGQSIQRGEQAVTLNGQMAVPFLLSVPAGLALGGYRAEIRIEGWLAMTADFDVR